MTTALHRRRRRLAATAASVTIAVAALPMGSRTTASAGWLTDRLGVARSGPSVAASAAASPDLLCSLLRSCAPTSTVADTLVADPAPNTLVPASGLDQITTTPLARPTTNTTAAPAPASAPTAAATNATCGEATTLPKRDGGTWTCSFSDEFSGTTLDRTKWVPQTTKWSAYTSGAQDCFVDSPNNVHVKSGYLILTSRREPAPFTCQITDAVGYPSVVTSGMVSTYQRFSQAYGRFEARLRVTGAAVPGLHEAFWLWPANDQRYGSPPNSGEIDIAEIYHAYPDRAIPFLHYNAQEGQVVTRNDCMISDIHAFHTYAAEWNPRVIRILYDGQLCMEASWKPQAPLKSPQPFDQPFIVALTQALGQPSVGPQNNGFNASTTPLPASTVVDYIRVYK